MARTGQHEGAVQAEGAGSWRQAGRGGKAQGPPAATQPTGG